MKEAIGEDDGLHHLLELDMGDVQVRSLARLLLDGANHPVEGLNGHNLDAVKLYLEEPAVCKIKIELKGSRADIAFKLDLLGVCLLEEPEKGALEIHRARGDDVTVHDEGLFAAVNMNGVFDITAVCESWEIFSCVGFNLQLDDARTLRSLGF